MKKSRLTRSGLLVGLSLLLAWPVQGQEAAPLSKGQLVYLPVYSHIYHGNFGRKGTPENVLLSAMVSIRNTDPKQPLRIRSARYFNTDGQLIREFLPQPRLVPAFGTLELFIERQDESGGSGANFAIAWESDVPVNPPLIQAVHANFESGRALSLTTTGRPVKTGD